MVAYAPNRLPVTKYMLLPSSSNRYVIVLRPLETSDNFSGKLIPNFLRRQNVMKLSIIVSVAKLTRRTH